MAAWPNGNSGGARIRTGWREKSRRKAEGGDAFFDSRDGANFLTIWLTVLFAGLPFGVRSRYETGDFAAGTDPGAPVAPRLVGTAISTTLISVAVFAVLVAFADFAG